MAATKSAGFQRARLPNSEDRRASMTPASFICSVGHEWAGIDGSLCAFSPFGMFEDPKIAGVAEGGEPVSEVRAAISIDQMVHVDFIAERGDLMRMLVPRNRLIRQ